MPFGQKSERLHVLPAAQRPSILSDGHYVAEERISDGDVIRTSKSFLLLFSKKKALVSYSLNVNSALRIESLETVITPL